MWIIDYWMSWRHAALWFTKMYFRLMLSFQWTCGPAKERVDLTSCNYYPDTAEVGYIVWLTLLNGKWAMYSRCVDGWSVRERNGKSTGEHTYWHHHSCRFFTRVHFLAGKRSTIASEAVSSGPYFIIGHLPDILLIEACQVCDEGACSDYVQPWNMYLFFTYVSCYILSLISMHLRP